MIGSFQLVARLQYKQPFLPRFPILTGPVDDDAGARNNIIRFN
jgi:hypothetical protein